MRMISFLLLGLAACGISEDQFTDTTARLLCEKTEECEPEQFNAMFDSQSDCRNFYEAILSDDDDDDAASCTFDASMASKCISEVRAASCDDFDDGDAAPSCELVYDCDDVEEGDEDED